MDATAEHRAPLAWRPAAVGLGLVLVVLLGAALLARRGTDGPTHNDADIGFLRDMIDHHDQANFISAIALRGSASVAVRNAALDVVAAQRYEVGLMEGWLIEWGIDEGDPNRDAMAWMGMPSKPGVMPGMATPAQLDELAKASGEALDVRFVELMIEHHRGGVHMAEAARESAGDPQVRWLAGRMVRNQRQEIRELETLLVRIGSAQPDAAAR